MRAVSTTPRSSRRSTCSGPTATAVKQRKDTVKRVLLAVPFVAPLNERRGWFQPPEPRKS